MERHKEQRIAKNEVIRLRKEKKENSRLQPRQQWVVTLDTLASLILIRTLRINQCKISLPGNTVLHSQQNLSLDYLEGGHVIELLL